MLWIKNVTAGYGEKIVVSGITMEVRNGEFLGLIGPNGSGKTTLLRAINGSLKLLGGEIILQDEVLSSYTRRRLARIMAFLPQDPASELAFTVREIAALGRSPHLPRFFPRETLLDIEIAEKAMELADVSHIANRFITQISGGERQRAFIAMCLAQEPHVLLLDEPTSHLDIGHQLSMLDLVQKLNKENGMTVVAVFHDLNLAAEYCDRLVMLNKGVVVAQGTPDQVVTAEIVRDVYHAEVIVEPNPRSHRPHVILSARLS